MPRRGSTSCGCEKKKAGESIPDPKGRESRTLVFFPCKPAFLGSDERGRGRVLGPLATRCRARGEGHAPSWQYFLRLRNWLRESRCPKASPTVRTVRTERVTNRLVRANHGEVSEN